MGGKILSEADGIGRVFHRLTVLGWAGKTERNHRLWRCACSCGREHITEMYPLTAGLVKSCGCYKVDMAGSHSITHGAASIKSDPEARRVYRVWTGIRRRCLSPKSKAYADYGGRGVTLCDEWLDFSNFSRDMGPNSEGMTVERIDVNKGYEPGNCIWIPLSKQNENKRNTLRVTYNGKEWCLKRLCEHLEVPYNRTFKRLRRMPLAEAIDLPSTCEISLVNGGTQC